MLEKSGANYEDFAFKWGGGWVGLDGEGRRKGGERDGVVSSNNLQTDVRCYVWQDQPLPSSMRRNSIMKARSHARSDESCRHDGKQAPGTSARGTPNTHLHPMTSQLSHTQCRAVGVMRCISSHPPLSHPVLPDRDETVLEKSLRSLDVASRNREATETRLQDK